jgi:two-component system, LytTR family, response regulator
VTTSIGVLLADDEPPARQLLRRHLAAISDLREVGECASGDELGEAIDRLRPHLVLLDVCMPGADVFEVLARIVAQGRPLPCVIFTTAYDRYAIRAFEVNAVDYLLKPFSEERFAQSVDRARARLRGVSVSNAEGLQAVLRDLGRRPDRLLVPEGARMVPVQVGDIDFIRAEGDYARIFSKGKGHLVCRGLTELEQRLDPERFLRIHRSVIVNRDRIREVRREGSSRYGLVLVDGTPLVVSRGRADALRRWMV